MKSATQIPPNHLPVCMSCVWFFYIKTDKYFLFTTHDGEVRSYEKCFLCGVNRTSCYFNKFDLIRNS